MNNQWHVMVVEDTEDDSQVISQILLHHGIQVSVTRNGIECMSALEQAQPTVVIMDLSMPVMDGWSTLVAMRCNPATAHIPVIAMTAYHSPEVAKHALENGFDAYIPKPVHPATFLQELADVLGLTV